MKKKFCSGGRLRLLLAPVRRGRGHFIIQGLENFDLRFLLAINEILAKQVPGARRQHPPGRS